MVIFTGEILNGKLHFLCSEICKYFQFIFMCWLFSYCFILRLLLSISIKPFDKSLLAHLATIFARNSVNFLSYSLKVAWNWFNKFVPTLNIKKKIRFNFHFAPLCTVWKKFMKASMTMRLRILPYSLNFYFQPN